MQALSFGYKAFWDSNHCSSRENSTNKILLSDLLIEKSYISVFVLSTHKYYKSQKFSLMTPDSKSQVTHSFGPYKHYFEVNTRSHRWVKKQVTHFF